MMKDLWRNSRDLMLIGTGAGVIAGMRAFSALAWGVRATDARGKVPLDALAALELLGDKLPFTPDRISPPALLARAASGGISALLITRSKRKEVALAGVLGAVASSYATFYARRALSRNLKVPDAVWGAAEDALTQAAGARLLHRARAA
jgi:uncharacterized membrane protein